MDGISRFSLSPMRITVPLPKWLSISASVSFNDFELVSFDLGMIVSLNYCMFIQYKVYLYFFKQFYVNLNFSTLKFKPLKQL